MYFIYLLAVDVGRQELGVVGMGHDPSLEDVVVVVGVVIVFIRVLLSRRRQQDRSGRGQEVREAKLPEP